MQIVGETCFNGQKTTIGKLYVDQSVKVWLDQGQKRSVKFGRGVRQGFYLLLILFNLYSKYATMKAVEGFGKSKNKEK